MSLPYKRIPAGIAAFTDPTGKLPAAQLSNVPGVGDFQLQAARSMRALKAAARADGLIVASVGDYRSFDEQKSLFLSRYSHGRTGATTDRFWHSGLHEGDDQWWKLVSGASAAEPGTSNHGLGLANDFALNIGGQIVSLDTRTGPNNVSLFDWLTLARPQFGWAWGENTAERWHWVYIEGDVIPGAVLSFERAHNIVFDYAFGFTDPWHLAASGIQGLVRYAGDFSRSKVAGRSEIDLIHAAGLAFAAVFEDSASSWTTGFDGGLIRGKEAQAWRVNVGHPPDRPIYCADFDTSIPASNFPLAAEHMRGFNAAVPGVNGAYAEGALLDYLFDHGLIGFGWQSASDSFPGNNVDNPRASLWQRVRATFPQFPTGLYDENDVNPNQRDWGQTPRPTLPGDTVAQPFTLFITGGVVYAVPDNWQSRVPLGASGSPAVVQAQAVLKFAGLDQTIHSDSGITAFLGAVPILTDDATASAISALSTKVGTPAQAATTASKNDVTAAVTAVNAHTDEAFKTIVVPPPPPPDMTKVKGHIDSLPGDMAFTTSA